jgi:hypothetical protein
MHVLHISFRQERPRRRVEERIESVLANDPEWIQSGSGTWLILSRRRAGAFYECVLKKYKGKLFDAVLIFEVDIASAAGYVEEWIWDWIRNAVDVDS